MKNYFVAHLDDIAPQRCPCGTTRRAFAEPGNFTATLHRVDISADSRAHYHKALTEIYLVLEGTGHVELDGDMIPVTPMTAIMIKPGCRHRAIGKLRIANICIPPFNPEDEWFD